VILHGVQKGMKPFVAAALACACVLSCGVPGLSPAPRGSEKSITAFSFVNPPASGSIDQEGHAIQVEVPAGTDITSLVAVFTTTGARVAVADREQQSGDTPNDFSAPLSYVVTAEDESTVSYQVAVHVAPPVSAEKAISAFSICAPPAVGVIDAADRTITVTVPRATDLGALVAEYVTTGVRVQVDDTEQVSGVTVNDFSDPLPYTVIAEDGSTACYAVTVTALPGSKKELTAFSIAGMQSASAIDAEQRIVRVRVPEGTDPGHLVAEFVTTGAAVMVDGREQESGVTANDFTRPVVYRVTAEDGSAADWSVRVASSFALLVNEIDADQVGTDNAEYIELIARAETDLGGLVVVMLNGGVTPGQEYARIDLGPAGSLPAGGYLVIAGPNVPVPPGAVKLTPAGWEFSNRIQNGPSDAIMLFDTIGNRVIDTVSYNGSLHRAVLAGDATERDATEGSAGAPADSNTTLGSLARVPDGQDTGQNGVDFMFTAKPTPGAPNM
jgi:hypothetical protein